MHIVRTTAGEAKSSILPKLLLNFVQFASLFQNSRNILEIFSNFILLQFCETFRETTAVLLVSLFRETHTSIFNKTLFLYLQYTYYNVGSGANNKICHLFYHIHI